MSVVTRRPGGGWTRVSTESDYGSVVSNWAATIAAAQAQADNVELERMVFQYKNGDITYQELVRFLNGRISAATPGTAKELELRQLLSDAQEYEDNNQRSIKRSKLEAGFAKGGISAQERLRIEEEMLASYKTGTPAYEEQLNTVSAARELAREEERTEKIAQIESRLYDGDLGTEDQLGLLDQALALSEPGTQEYNQLQRARAGLEEQLKDEERLRIQSDLMDQFASGGISDEEGLQIVRALLELEEPGTAEYVDLKEQEAKLLESIGKGGGASKEQLRSAALEFERMSNSLNTLQERFNAGLVSPEEYISNLSGLVDTQTAIYEQYPDEFNPQEAAAMEQQLQEATAAAQGFADGSIVFVDTKQGRIPVPAEEVAAYAEEGVYKESEEDLADRPGKVVSLVGPSGESKRYLINEETGAFEELRTAVDPREPDKPFEIKTGATFTDPGEITRGVPREELQAQTAAEQAGFRPDIVTSFQPKTAQPALSFNTQAQEKERRSISDRVKDSIEGYRQAITSEKAGFNRTRGRGETSPVVAPTTSTPKLFGANILPKLTSTLAGLFKPKTDISSGYTSPARTARTIVKPRVSAPSGTTLGDKITDTAKSLFGKTKSFFSGLFGGR